jgi:hypothetical protein
MDGKCILEAAGVVCRAGEINLGEFNISRQEAEFIPLDIS